MYKFSGNQYFSPTYLARRGGQWATYLEVLNSNLVVTEQQGDQYKLNGLTCVTNAWSSALPLVAVSFR